MRILLATACAVPIFFIAGCNSDPALTELARNQGKQAAQLEKISIIIEQQKSQDGQIKKLSDIISEQSDQLKAMQKLSAANAEAPEKMKKKPLGTTLDDQRRAAMLLAKSSNRSISGQAIYILGYLGGEEVESFLLDKVKKGSRDYSQIISALSRMKSSTLRPIVLEYLASGNTSKINAASNALSNNYTTILTKKDVPEIVKIINRIPNNNYNNNSYIRRNLIKTLIKLDQDKGVKYLCESMATAQPNQLQNYANILGYNGATLSFKNWQKLLKVFGGPSRQKIHAFRGILSGLARCPDYRYTELILPWAELLKKDIYTKPQYVSTLRNINDPKAAKVMLELCTNDSRYSRSLDNYPGITKKDGKYVLVDDAAMEKLMDKRNKVLASIIKREEEKEKNNKK